MFGTVAGRMAAARTILVTGAAGFIGRRLLAALAGPEHAVHALVRPGGRRPDAGPVVHVADVASLEALETVRAARADVVVHLAVMRNERTPEARLAAARTNVLGTATMLEAAQGVGTRRFVHLGGALEHGRAYAPIDEATPVAPDQWYGATKAAASLLVSASQVPSIILRPTIVYGPGQAQDRLIPQLLSAARDGGRVPLTSAGHARDWVHVDDVVAAIVAAIRREDLKPGVVVDVASGEQHTNEQVVALARAVTGRRIDVGVGALDPRRWDRPRRRVDPGMLERLLGVRPRSLHPGLKDTWEQLR